MLFAALVVRLGLDSRFNDGFWLWIYVGLWTLIPYVSVWNVVRDQSLRDRLTVNIQGSIPRILWDSFCLCSRFLSAFFSSTLLAEFLVIIPMIVLFWPWALQGIFIGSLRFVGLLKDFSEDLSEL